MAIDPRGADLKRLLAEDDGKPVVMLNLLRFRPDGGEATYLRYSREAGPHLAKVGGEVLYFGRGATALVAEAGQAWDAVLVVRYPSRTAFSQMVMDPAYQAITHLRGEALLEAVLQPTTAYG